MGLSRKPMIVVPNHVVEQFAADVYRLYPAAKLLAAGKKDFEAKNRRRIFAKIATGDWDMVVVPHSSFGFISISPEAEERYLGGEVRIARHEPRLVPRMPILSNPRRSSHATARRASITACRHTCTVRTTLELTM